jgi:hypothetical protein
MELWIHEYFRYQTVDFLCDPPRVCEISSLSAAGKFAYIVRLRKGEKSFKINLAHTPITFCEPSTAVAMKQPPPPPLDD